MDCKKAAVARLREYENMCLAAENLRLQIRLLRQKQADISGLPTDRVVVCAGNYGRGDWLVENIAHLQQMETSLERTRQWLRITDGALAALDSEEQMLLRMFYIRKQPGTLEKLCQLLEVEKSTVYRRRDKALQKFMQSLYGVNVK